MDPTANDQSVWQWVAAFSLGIVGTAYGFFRDIYRKIDAVRRSSERHVEITRAAAETGIESARAAAKEGDDANHPSSVGVALVDNQVMQAARLSAPVGDLFKSVQQVETPASGSTVQIADDTGTLIIKGSATLAALTIELIQQPTAVMDITIIFQVGVTSLTLTAPSGYTINVPVSGQQIAAGGRVFLHLDDTVWC